MISQAYISQSVSDFPFLDKFNLVPYHDTQAPAIFFGVYSTDDLLAILRHKGFKVIYWCGQDAKDFQDWELVKDCKHITCLKKVYDHLWKNIGIDLFPYLLNQFNIIPPAEPVKLGNKIYCYLPLSYPKYHGLETLINIQTKYEIIIGDGSIPQSEWHQMNNEIYSQCFVGLVLSEFAGGGQTIIELGIRGIKCITNVLELPNVLNWMDRGHIQDLITKEAKKIGRVQTELANQVVESLDTKFEFLTLEYYG